MKNMELMLSVLLGILTGGGLSLPICGALSLKFGWNFGVDAPKAVLDTLHINAVIGGLSCSTIGLAISAAILWQVKTLKESGKSLT